jgi:hypothetical protein
MLCCLFMHTYQLGNTYHPHAREKLEYDGYSAGKLVCSSDVFPRRPRPTWLARLRNDLPPGLQLRATSMPSSSPSVALGNFPQAFTHLSLISACYHLDDALNKAMRPQLAI